MVVGRQKLLSLAVLSGLGVDAVRGVYHLPRNVTVSSIPEAHSQSTTVDPDETPISLFSVGSTVEVTSASQTFPALATQTVGVETVNSLQPNTQDVVTASESAISAPPISTVPTGFDPFSTAPSEAVSSTISIIVSSSSSVIDANDGLKTSASTSGYSSQVEEEGSTITTGSLPSSDSTSSSSLAWNYAPVGQKSESPSQNDATPTVGAVPGGIVVIPPDIPPWVEQTASFGEDVSLGQPPLETLPGGIVNLPPEIPPWVEQTASFGEDVSLGQPPLETLPGGIVNLPPDIPPWVEQTASFGEDVSLGQPPVEIPTSWDYVPATTTSDVTSTRGQFISSGWNQTTAPYYNQSSTWTTPGSVTRSSSFPNTTTTLSSSTISYCQPSDLTATVTSWQVVHISTITWIGDPTDYTQPYPTLIPPPVETIPPCIDLVTRTTPPPGITLTTCFTVTASGSETKSCTLTVSTNSWGYGPQTSTTIRSAPTVTFITTDKNPAIVYSPIQTPNYGVTNDNTKSPRPTAVSVDPVDPPVYNTFHSNNSPGEVTKPAPKPVTVIVKPTEVIIGGSTITDNPTTKTQTVVVGGETFTVGPTQVVGGGATVTRPSTTKGGGGGGVIYAPVPTSTKLNDLPIIVRSSVAVIGTGSSSFTLPPTPTTVVVEDHTVSIGPSGIAIVDPKGNPIIATVTVPPPRDQTITIGPGSNNEPKTTTVDGVPIAIISSSVAIIGTASSTLTLPASSPTTITIDNGGLTIDNGGHTLTLGPSGITLTAPLPPNAIATASPVTTIQTLSMPLPSVVTSQPQPPSTATEVVVAGGQLLTAIGRSVLVIHGTTITYTTLSSPLTTVVDGEDTVVLDPSQGVLITHNHPIPGATAVGPGAVTVTTLGGPNANPSATEFAVVGGATITKVGASVVVVEGVTYTVGPSATAGGGKGGGVITTVLSGSGQTLTIGPEGVVVGTMTISYPFNGDGGEGGSSTTVIFPGAGGGAEETATATAAGASGSGSAKDGDDDEDVGVSLQVLWKVMMLGLGVAGTVGVFGL